jgi:hypothetical protein
VARGKGVITKLKTLPVASHAPEDYAIPPWTTRSAPSDGRTAPVSHLEALLDLNEQLLDALTTGVNRPGTEEVEDMRAGRATNTLVPSSLKIRTDAAIDSHVCPPVTHNRSKTSCEWPALRDAFARCHLCVAYPSQRPSRSRESVNLLGSLAGGPPGDRTQDTVIKSQQTAQSIENDGWRPHGMTARFMGTFVVQ